MNLENTEKLSVRERLIMFINYENLSQSKFEKMANLSNGYVNNIKNSISDKIFEGRIQPAFPELNKIWLFHGKGPMKVNSESELEVNNISEESIIKNKPHDEQMEILLKRIVDLENNILEKNNSILALIEVYLAPMAVKMGIEIDSDFKKSLFDHIN